MIIEKPPDWIAPTVDFAGNGHPVVRANGFQTERSPVQCLMVQPAQRQSVYDFRESAFDTMFPKFPDQKVPTRGA